LVPLARNDGVIVVRVIMKRFLSPTRQTIFTN
jgi:hypothetical protein